MTFQKYWRLLGVVLTLLILLSAGGAWAADHKGGAPAITAPSDAKADLDSAKKGGPVAFIPESEHDFGTVDGKEVSFDFLIVNRGDQDLVIDQVSPG